LAGMIVKLYGGLRQKAGTSQLPASGATVRQVLHHLCQQHPGLQATLFDDDQLRSHVRVIVNGRDTELDQGLETPVSEPDQIAVFPPIAGG
jgi:molybdopterin synthase sulfur carrier subunit